MRILREPPADVISVDFNDGKILGRHYLDDQDHASVQMISEQARNELYVALANSFAHFRLTLRDYEQAEGFDRAIAQNKSLSAEDLFAILNDEKRLWRMDPQYYHAISILLRRKTAGHATSKES